MPIGQWRPAQHDWQIPFLQIWPSPHSAPVQATVPPQPFEALPLQRAPHASAAVLGVQQLPAWHTSPAAHVPHEPPQPFEPQLPEQLGVQHWPP